MTVLDGEKIDEIKFRLIAALDGVRASADHASLMQNQAVNSFENFLKENRAEITDLEDQDGYAHGRILEEIHDIAYSLNGKVDGFEFWENSNC